MAPVCGHGRAPIHIVADMMVSPNPGMGKFLSREHFRALGFAGQRRRRSDGPRSSLVAKATKGAGGSNGAAPTSCRCLGRQVGSDPETRSHREPLAYIAAVSKLSVGLSRGSIK